MLRLQRPSVGDNDAGSGSIMEFGVWDVLLLSEDLSSWMCLARYRNIKMTLEPF
jgi:hypothetical protein